MSTGSVVVMTILLMDGTKGSAHAAPVFWPGLVLVAVAGAVAWWLGRD